MTKKIQKCYIYTRVSTAIQVDGYSLEAQKDKLRKYAEFQDYTIAGENVYQLLLLAFDELYEEMDEPGKKELLRAIIERINLYP